MSFERSVLNELGEIRREIKLLRTEMNHYKGFVGGLIWALSAIATTFGSFYWLFRPGGHDS